MSFCGRPKDLQRRRRLERRRGTRGRTDVHAGLAEGLEALDSVGLRTDGGNDRSLSKWGNEDGQSGSALPKI